MHASLPLYRSIAENLKEKIESSQYPHGTQLPTEARLTEIYHASRVTIRQAIQILVRQGYVKKRQGSGSQIIYSHQNALRERSSKIESFTEEIRATGLIPSKHMLNFAIITLSNNLANDLQVSPSSQAYHYQRLICTDKTPFCLEEGFIPLDPFPDLTVSDLLHSKLNYYEQKKHIEISFSHQIVQAITPTEEQCNLLQLSKPKPLLRIKNLIYQANGLPLDETIQTFDADIYPASFIKVRKL